MIRSLPVLLLVAALLCPASAIAHRPVFHLNSTAYGGSGCDASSGGSLMADNRGVHGGAVANNLWPFGTRIELMRVWGRRSASFDGRRRFTVEDRIGSGSELDFYTGSCDYMDAWGRRDVTLRIVRWGWHRWLR